MKVRMYNVGFGDCFCLRDRKKSLLVDFGTNNSRIEGRPRREIFDVIISDLSTINRKNLLLTHFHMDHLSGLLYMMKNRDSSLDFGKIYLPDRVLYLETAAFLTVDAYDKYIYRTQWDNVSERQELLKRIYEQAQYTRGEELTTEDQMVALSTCSTSGTNARHVLICRIVHSSASEEGSGKVYVETENE